MVRADWTPVQLRETEGESLVGWTFPDGKKYMAEECANLLNPTQPRMVAEEACSGLEAPVGSHLHKDDVSPAPLHGW